MGLMTLLSDGAIAELRPHGNPPLRQFFFLPLPHFFREIYDFPSYI
jgi:hypothetical protein